MRNSPYNLEATVRLLQRRPGNPVDRWEEGRYLRAFATPEGERLVAVAQGEGGGAGNVRIEIVGGTVSAATARDLTATVRWVLGLDEPAAPVEWLGEMEPRVAGVAAALQGFRPPCFPSLFETCAAVLPFQQLSLDAGVAILGRLVARFGATLRLDGRDWLVFPEPEAIAAASVEALRAVGLSRPKAAALRELARLAAAGGLDRARFASLPTADALKALRALPGVGPWSAGLTLLRGLRRMDVFPPGDVGAARNLAALLGGGAMSPADANAFAARFGDRQGYLYYLCLGSQLLQRGLITPW